MEEKKTYKRHLYGELFLPDVDNFEEKKITTRKKKDLRVLLLDEDNKIVTLSIEEVGEGSTPSPSPNIDDVVLKYGEFTIDTNLINIPINAFQWRINEVITMNTPIFSAPVPDVSLGLNRKDILVGTQEGGYEVILGIEGLKIKEPIAGPGKIKLATISTYSLNNSTSALFVSDIVVSLPNGITLGGYSNGQTIPSAGKTSEEVINLLAKVLQVPELIVPTFSIALSNTGIKEVGSTYTSLITGTFNAGKIKGKTVLGVWEQDTLQGDRAGVATSYTLDTSVQPGNTYTMSRVLEPGSNEIIGSVTHAAGIQPKDSSNENYSSPFPSGTIIASSLFISAIYPVFYGTLNIDQTILDINLSAFTKVTNINPNNTVSIPYSNVLGKQLVILIPTENTIKTKWYVTESNKGGIDGITGDLFALPVTASYNSPTLLWLGKSYRVYISTPTSINTTIELRN